MSVRWPDADEEKAFSVKLRECSFTALAENVNCLMLVDIARVAARTKCCGVSPRLAAVAATRTPGNGLQIHRSANPSFCIMIPNVEIMLSSGGWTAGHTGEQADCLNIDYR